MWALAFALLFASVAIPVLMAPLVIVWYIILTIYCAITHKPQWWELTDEEKRQVDEIIRNNLGLPVA